MTRWAVTRVPFDFYTGFVDGDKVVEDLFFCKSIIAGAKVQDLCEINLKLLCVKTT